MLQHIPQEIRDLAAELAKAGFQAYLVGGCVRDLLRGAVYGEPVEPKDWDIATDAEPEKIQEIFSTFAGATADKPATVYENEFGTVGVKTGSENEKLKIVEVTTFRFEGKYTDKRHPDSVTFAKTVEEDLSRRDFTVNALALSLVEGMADKVVDPFGGEKDLKQKIVRTVGKAEDRFEEDALRLMRAVRFTVELGFQIDPMTREAARKKAGLLEMIAKERVRDELVKILLTPRAADGILLLEELGLLRYVMPELREGIGVGQNKHHIYTVFEHNVRALDYAAGKNYELHVRMAALLHDVGKPRTKSGDGIDSTFYHHEAVGANMALRMLDHLRFPKEFTERVTHLVRSHLFYYNVGEVTPAGVRRFLARVGSENVDDLVKVREADRIGSGVPKAVPYKIRHLLFMIEKVKHDPISPKTLVIRGDDVMKIAAVPPSPKVGQILSALLEEVLEDPEKNTREHLEGRVLELALLSEQKLASIAEKAKERKEEFESGVEEEMKRRYYVK